MNGVTPPDELHDGPADMPVHVAGQVELFTVDAVGGPADAPADDPAGADPGLTEQDRAMLDFERRAWTRPGAKEQQIRERFGLTPVVYFLHLNRLLNTRAALEYAPTVVNRLRRVRESRAGRS